MAWGIEVGSGEGRREIRAWEGGRLARKIKVDLVMGRRETVHGDQGRFGREKEGD